MRWFGERAADRRIAERSGLPVEVAALLRRKIGNGYAASVLPSLLGFAVFWGWLYVHSWLHQLIGFHELAAGSRRLTLIRGTIELWAAISLAVLTGTAVYRGMVARKVRILLRDNPRPCPHCLYALEAMSAEMNAITCSECGGISPRY